MKQYPLAELRPNASAVFIDNVAICSADRILGGLYDSVKDDPLLQQHYGEPSPGPAALVAHDLVNLNILIESLLCYDEIYTNAEYVDRWNSEIASGMLARLGDVVTGVSISPPRTEGSRRPYRAR